MHILFIDESGTPPKPNQKEPKYFVLGGVIIPEAGWSGVRDAVHGMKLRRKIRGEMKWRYFSPNNQDPRNPMRKLEQGERDAIRADLYKIICGVGSIKSIAAVCSAAAGYAMASVNSQDDLYHLAYKVLTERFQYYLQDISKLVGRKEYGIIVGDHRGAHDDKRLRMAHQRLLYSTGDFISKYPNMIESLFLEPSHLSIGIQLADMVSGAVWRKYERGDDRWFQLCESSFRRGPRGEILGFGLVHVPKAGWK
jgi:hypothetical protein